MLGHFQLHGNAADSHFVDDSSLLSKPENEDESWLKGTGFLSIFIIYH